MTVPLKRKGNTSIRREDGDTIVRYHRTDIVRFNAERIVLDHGGWRTISTKARMNQASEEYGLGFTVYQEKHLWYVVKNDRPFPGPPLAFNDPVKVLARR